MKFLAINTSTSLCSVSLYENSNFETLEEKNAKDHTVFLGEYTHDLLKGKPESIDFLAVSVGPGSYAGIRTGVSFCKGLSLALEKPIIPVNNFDCMQDLLNITGKYYLTIYSHKNFVYKQFYKGNEKISSAKCIEVNQLNDYPIYGCNLEHILDEKDFHQIELSSQQIGKYALKYYDKLIEKDINRVKPIYIEM